MKCPYENTDCTEVDTSGMTLLIPCEECKNYDNGIRATGATPCLAWAVDKFKKLINYVWK